MQEQSRAVQIKPPPLMFFSSSPLIEELLVLTCTVPDSLAKDIKHMHTHAHSDTF